MKTLFDYLNVNMREMRPFTAIDHKLRAKLHEGGKISCSIHPDGVDGKTMDFWVDGNTLIPKTGETYPQ